MIFQLLIINPQTGVSQTLTLPVGETILLGSDEQSGIQLQHPFVADSHAQLTISEQEVTLTDLESMNGTAVNGHRIPPNQSIPLQNGDVIDIALFQLTLTTIETSEAAVKEDEVVELATSICSAPPVLPPAPPNNMIPHQPPLPNYWEQMETVGFEPAFSRYVQYLPSFYDVPFMHRFLALFESLLEPIVWRIDSRDLLLDGQTAPDEFLPWLASWYAFTFDYMWTEAQKRALLHVAPTIFNWWGTARALQTVLDIYVGQPVTIVDDEHLSPFTFRVEVPLPPDDEQQAALSRLINTQKPAHRSFELLYTG